MKKTAVCLSMLMIVLAGYNLYAEEISIRMGPEGKDTYICDCLPNVNNPNGSIIHLYQGGYGVCFDRLLIQWDLSSLPEDITITNARMDLFYLSMYGAVSGEFVYFRILEDWEETGVTYATQPDYTDEGVIVTEFPTGGWHSVDVTEFVQGWYDGTFDNFGIYGHTQNSSGTCCVEFSSADGSALYRPKLTVEYTPLTVENPETSQPVTFGLIDCYPNPFNAEISINYSISRKGPVSLEIYNVLNQKVVDLVHEIKPAGNYTHIWEASDITSGVYYVHLIFGNERAVQKVVLLK